MVEGESLRSICRDENMPSIGGVMKVLNERPELVERYTRAREMQADAIFEEMIEIADDGSNDWMLKRADDPTSVVLNGEHVNRSRLRIDSRKWILGRMRPMKYGEQKFIGGVSDAPIEVKNTIDVSSMSLEELEVLEKLFGASDGDD